MNLLDGDATVGADLGLEARDLASSELVHAAIHKSSADTNGLTQVRHVPIVGVIHEVVDRVHASARAGVAAGRALVRCGGFGRGVGDRVTRARAATLEGVVEANPVPSFVRQGLGSTKKGNLLVRRAVNDEKKITLPRL